MFIFHLSKSNPAKGRAKALVYSLENVQVCMYNVCRECYSSAAWFMTYMYMYMIVQGLAQYGWGFDTFTDVCVDSNQTVLARAPQTLHELIHC